MGFPILVRRHLYTESDPRGSSQYCIRHKIISHKAAQFNDEMVRSLWNLTDAFTIVLLGGLSKFRAMGQHCTNLKTSRLCEILCYDVLHYLNLISRWTSPGSRHTHVGSFKSEPQCGLGNTYHTRAPVIATVGRSPGSYGGELVVEDSAWGHRGNSWHHTRMAISMG